ncbi:MAG: hypothetical protein GY822_11500 [Deltaproteobacteria bacterium]|nr:hypothetical protein [Deltaproteobacteria bacterium]
MLRSLLVLPLCGLFLAGCPVADGDPPPSDGGTPSPSANPCDLLSDCPDDGRPPLRTEMMGVWDEAQNRMILFGGNSAISEQCAFPTPSVNDFHGDTWAYHAKCGTWESLGTDNGPSPRARYMMAKDEASNRILLFGGRFRQTISGNYRAFNDLWSFDLASNSWSEIVTTNAPAARVNSGFAINPEGTKAYLFWRQPFLKRRLIQRTKRFMGT